MFEKLVKVLAVAAFRRRGSTGKSHQLMVFDESGYLAVNPDVAAAVKAGSIVSGAEHYAHFGVNENRTMNLQERPAPPKFPFQEGTVLRRRDKILASLDLKVLEGLEIGALDKPLVKPDEGNIFFVDHVDTETLLKKYGPDPSVDKANIVHVDAVWGLQTLQECIGSGRKVDYVVASHVIEHVPDLITWFAEIHSILRKNGSLRLAIPDRRYTFDYLRNESRIHDVLEAYLFKARSPLPRHIIEHCSLIRVVDCAAAWNGTLEPSELRPHSSTSAGIQMAKDAMENGTYHDSHCWVFTPATFAILCMEMAELDLLKFGCDYHIETPRNELEFYVSMVPSDSKTEIISSWRRMKSSLDGSVTYQHFPPHKKFVGN